MEPRKNCLPLLILITFYVICDINYGETANILALGGVMSQSHHIWNSALLYELANRGHNITFLSTDLPRNLSEVPTNVHYIHLEETYNSVQELSNQNNDKNMTMDDYIGNNMYIGIPMMYFYGIKNCEGILKSKGLKVLLNYPDDYKFDLVINDYSVGPCLLGFLHKFKYPPLVGVSAFLNPPVTQDIIGHHYFPGYVPYHFTSYDVNMTFFERAQNTLVYLADTIVRRFLYTPRINEMVREHFPADTPSLRDLEKRHLIALVNSHPAVNYPESLPPNVIEVGGMQLVDPKPLPDDMKSFMQGSKNRVIFFSLGTNMNWDEIGPQKIEIILETMRQLKEYNFLWKLDIKDDKLNIPKNVLIKPFFPQRDILAHPNLKAFVTHAGGLSTQESTWRGVPMIGLALFADQPRNLHKSILAGVAEKVDYVTLSVDSLKTTIRKVVEDKSYSERMKIRSARLRDTPMKPLETAVWWVEYILRNTNPEHLISPALHMNVLATHSLDVFFAFLAAISAFGWIFIYTCCKIWKKKPKHEKCD